MGDLSGWVLSGNKNIPQNNKINSSQDLSKWKAINNNLEDEESFFSKLPRNIATGLVHAGRGLHNSPHDIAEGVDYVGSGIGRFFGAKEFENGKSSHLSDYLPNDQTNYSDVFGQKGEGTTVDNIIQKGLEFSPDILMGANALKNFIPHLTRRGASKKLRNARELSRNRNIGPIDVNSDIIEDTAQFLPKTSPYKNELENAHYGDYDALFNLQSDLGKHASDYSKSIFSAAERAHGRAGLATRNRLLDEIHAGLKAQGHNDISDLLKQGQNEYRRYMKFKPYRNALGVAAGAYMMPKNAMIDLIKKLALVNKN